MRKHSLMQYPHNQDSVCEMPVKNDMLANFAPIQAGTDIGARTAYFRLPGQPIAGIFEFIEIFRSLGSAPRAQCIFGDAEEIGLGQSCETESDQASAPFGNFEGTAHPRE